MSVNNDSHLVVMCPWRLSPSVSIKLPLSLVFLHIFRKLKSDQKLYESLKTTGKHMKPHFNTAA